MATIEVEMRGIDLRAPVKGVTLVMNKGFSCQRNADQGLMRVGRYGDPFIRILCEGVQLDDKDLENALHKKLYKFSKARKPISRKFTGIEATGEDYHEAARKQEVEAKRKLKGQQKLLFKPQAQGDMPENTGADGIKHDHQINTGTSAPIADVKEETSRDNE